MAQAASQQACRDHETANGIAHSPRAPSTAEVGERNAMTSGGTSDTPDGDDYYAANEKRSIDQGKTALNLPDNISPPPLLIVPSNPPTDDRLQRASTAATDHERFPEGGLRAWLVVLGCWFALISSLGLMNTLGTFQSYLSSHQLSHYGEGTVGWIFSIYTFVVFFLGLFIGPVFDKYGPRWLVLAGSLSLCAGMMLFSISTREFYLSAAMSILKLYDGENCTQC